MIHKFDYSQAQRIIDIHLADSRLSPEGVAAELAVSLRALHALFQPTGESFGAYVRRRRLEECRAALIASPERPVMELALAWGFASTASFYRAFQAAFGMSPNELRAKARGGEHTQ